MICQHKKEEFPPVPTPDPRPTDDGHPREGRGWD